MPGTPQGSSQDDFRQIRPTVVVVMAEYGGVFLWNRSPGPACFRGSFVLNPVELGASPELIERLAAWNDEWEEMAYSNVGFASPEVERAWVQRGWELARELQDQLPDIQVLYHHDPRGEWPVGTGQR